MVHFIFDLSPPFNSVDFFETMSIGRRGCYLFACKVSLSWLSTGFESSVQSDQPWAKLLSSTCHSDPQHEYNRMLPYSYMAYYLMYTLVSVKL